MQLLNSNEVASDAEASEIEKPQEVLEAQYSKTGKEAGTTPFVVDNAVTVPNRLRNDEEIELRSPIKKLFKRNDDVMDRVLNQVDFEKKFASLPAFTPDDPQKGSRSEFFCVNNFYFMLSLEQNDGTVEGTSSLPSTPSALLRTILEKKCSRRDNDRKDSPLSTPRTPRTIHSTPKTPGTEDSGEFAVLFFKNYLVFAKDECVSPLTQYSPRTPNTPLDGCAEKSTSRRLLDHRRQLVVELLEEYGMFPTGQATSAFQNKYRQFFPNKQTLTLKIREVRQKMMASMQSPLTPSSDCISQKPDSCVINQSAYASLDEPCYVSDSSDLSEQHLCSLDNSHKSAFIPTGPTAMSYNSSLVSMQYIPPNINVNSV
ncbi:unnamed protein product [Gongylonema pulchrum]|uniref:Protein capicua homolog n=1 Tax=Gongylonema pulchrum TaxID=637853 RepID=A0A183DZM9_9BILA|nr:unnamed protein product [Gongylonema pulchrum]